ncbi:hypothetical protein Vretifemale_16857, partial [Volvox reticuliferus]
RPDGRVSGVLVGSRDRGVVAVEERLQAAAEMEVVVVLASDQDVGGSGVVTERRDDGGRGVLTAEIINRNSKSGSPQGASNPEIIRQKTGSHCCQGYSVIIS